MHVRYTTSNGKETRAERNERFGAAVPDYEIPDHGLFLWSWYFSVSNGLRRVVNGEPVAIPASEFLAWSQLTGTVVSPSEYAILRQMDIAYCEAMGEEIENNTAIAKAEAEAAASAKGKSR